MKPLPIMLFAGAIAVSAYALAADARFASADSNGDGEVTKAEAAIAMPDLTEDAFNAADADQSGGLSEKEFVAAVEEGILPKG